MSRSKASPWDGLVLVDKEPGWTSHDVVAKARGVLGTRKVGHAGTLDPPEEVRSAVRERVDEVLARLPLARRPRVSVVVAATKGVK